MHRFDCAKMATQIATQQELNPSKSIDCGESGCRAVFADESAYSEHYESRHRNICAECRRSFQSRFHLDMHVSESHDPFFELKAVKEPSYRCLLPTCSEKFQCSANRKDHMIKLHKFPTDYRFLSTSKKSTTDKNAMDVDNQDGASAVSSSSSAFQVENSICFGAGSRKGFDRRRLGKPWFQAKKSAQNNAARVGEHGIDLSEIGESLP